MSGEQLSLRAVYMRGGTSRALFFRREDLPPAVGPHDNSEWNAIFCSAIGAPDPYGRQLDGIGGGVSSLSKVAVIGPPTRPDADVDYTFAQVAIKEPIVGYRGNCGNISSAVGPFAVDEGLVAAQGDEACVRIHNTNTSKIIEARFSLVEGKAAVDGEMALDGVAGTGAPIRLAFLDPGGAATGRLLPTGAAVDRLDCGVAGVIEASLVDAANPTVFVAARAVGLTGREAPQKLEADRAMLERFEAIRIAAARAMGLAATDAELAKLKNLPLVSLIYPAREDENAEVGTLMISSGQPHRATPLTGAMCLAVAAQIDGSTVARELKPNVETSAALRVAHPSGVVTVGATIVNGRAVETVVYRTARRLMDGRIYFRRSASN
jgi:2-methylaconitate cis-trans-isomerase PrpF